MFRCVCMCTTCSVYRLDYDIAVGVSGARAKEAALYETTQPTEPMPYDNSEQFAVWCKTQLNPVDWKMAAALAAARMTGRVWTWVRTTDELRPGEHVAFNSGTVYYYQHAIVTDVQGDFVVKHLVILCSPTSCCVLLTLGRKLSES